MTYRADRRWCPSGWPVDVKRTYRTAALDASFGRIAPLQRPLREGPESVPKPPFHCERGIASPPEAGLMPVVIAAPQPRRSPGFLASARTPRAPARERRGLRRGGPWIDRVSLAQAPRAVRSCESLALGDGDGGQERFLGRRGVGGIALKQHFSADPMQLGFECAMTDPLARRQRLLVGGESTVDLAGAGFGQGNLDEPVEAMGVPIAQKFGAATLFLRGGCRPNLRRHPHPGRTWSARFTPFCVVLRPKLLASSTSPAS